MRGGTIHRGITSMRSHRVRPDRAKPSSGDPEPGQPLRPVGDGASHHTHGQPAWIDSWATRLDRTTAPIQPEQGLERRPVAQSSVLRTRVVADYHRRGPRTSQHGRQRRSGDIEHLRVGEYMVDEVVELDSLLDTGQQTGVSVGTGA